MITTEESKDITVNGVRVTCYSDGSVDSHGIRGGDRSFGSTNGDGYMQKNVNLQNSKSTN